MYRNAASGSLYNNAEAQEYTNNFWQQNPASHNLFQMADSSAGMFARPYRKLYHTDPLKAYPQVSDVALPGTYLMSQASNLTFPATCFMEQAPNSARTRTRPMLQVPNAALPDACFLPQTPNTGLPVTYPMANLPMGKESGPISYPYGQQYFPQHFPYNKPNTPPNTEHDLATNSWVASPAPQYQGVVRYPSPPDDSYEEDRSAAYCADPFTEFMIRTTEVEHPSIGMITPSYWMIRSN